MKISVDRSARRAARSAASEVLGELGAAPDLALLFATVGYDQAELVASVREVLGDACVLAGCSGEGIIAQAVSNESDHALVLMAVRFQGTTAEARLVEGYAADPVRAAAELAAQIGGAGDVVGVLLFPDGLLGNCTAFLHELAARLPGVPAMVGGTAGDDMRFERTYQYCNGQVHSGAVAAVVLRGAGRLRIDVSHGCTPVGPHQRVTRVDGAWLEEIDGRPAWDVFKDYLDGDPVDLNAEGIVHLCVGTAARPSDAAVADPMIIRTPLALKHETGALLFPGGGLVEGQPIRMTRRDADQIRTTAVACARSVVAGGAGAPAFVLHFDCAGRGKVLFGDGAADTIVVPLQEQLGRRVPWAGFHTYGEIAPSEGGLAYHNYTVALAGFYDV